MSPTAQKTQPRSQRSQTDETRKVVVDAATSGAYAAIGATDLVVARLREAAAEAEKAREQVRALDAKQLSDRVSHTLQQLPTQAVSTALDLAGRAEKQFDDLAARGKSVAGRIRGQRASEELVRRSKVAVSRTKAAVTTVRGAATSTAAAGVATVAAEVADTATDAADAATTTTGRARRTATTGDTATARKTTKKATGRATTARTTSARKSTAARSTAARSTAATQARKAAAKKTDDAQSAVKAAVTSATRAADAAGDAVVAGSEKLGS